MQTIKERLVELGHEPLAASPPAANYVPTTQLGNILFVSGQVSRSPSDSVEGIVGRDVSLEDGTRAARIAALNVIAQIEAVVGGKIERVARIARLGVFVAASTDFAQHSQVANGASDLIAAVFEDAGRHARSAIGVASLPTGVAVEIDAIVELRA